MSTDTTALQEKALRALRGRETPQTEAKEEERTMSSNDLTKRIARALYENAEYYGPEDAQPSWDSLDNEEREEWMEIAAAVLPVIAAEVRAAKAEAWTDCVSEASALGWLHALAALDMLDRNPYETEDQP